MTMLKLRQEAATTSTAGTAAVVQELVSRPTTDGPEGYGARPEDELDALMHQLASEDASFGTLLEEAGKELAPLATAEGGAPTLTSLRMAAGLTQRQLADRIGQRQSNVSYLESGQRTNIHRDTMKRMCEALGCDMNTLDRALETTAALLHERQAAQDATVAQHAEQPEVERRRA